MPPNFPSAHGSTMSFDGSAPQRMISLRFNRSRSRIDVTGFGSPAFTKEVVPGDFDPATIAVTVLAEQPFVFGDSGTLNLQFSTGYAVSFSDAFLESVDIGADVGEYTKATYTFVACS